MTEKRIYPRRRFDRPVKCISTSLMFDCRGFNLSPGGIGIRSPVGLEPEEELALLIPIGDDGEKIIIALGKVAWIETHNEHLNDYPTYAGIKFIATSEKYRSNLDMLCKVSD